MTDSAPVTLKSIAKIVGCSDSTVSRVISGKSKQFRISPKTEQKILDLAKELHFVPNPIAASLRTRRTLTIGLVIPDISNPFFAGIAPHVERECRQLGYSVLLADTEENTDLEIESVSILHKRSIDGLIIAPVGQTFDHLERLYKSGLPVVIIDRYFPDSTIPYVTSDNYQGGYDAATHLIENGHKMIACIQGLPYATPNSERVRGYRDALAAAGVTENEDWIVGDSFGEENGYYETRILLKEFKRPTALFALSNLISLGALRAISEEHLRVPEDISLISFDDQPYSNLLATPMTTVSQQIHEMGKIAMQMLYRQMKAEKGAVEESVKLATTIIRRNSVRTL